MAMPIKQSGKWILAVLLGLVSAQAGYSQVILNQVDTFQDGTLQGWGNGGIASPPVNISTGGPGGAGDRFLQISSGAFGGGLRSVVFNQSQWIGDYSGAAVAKIEMDLKNFTASVLSIRWALRSVSGGPGSPGYVSTVAFSLPSDGLWHHAVFLLDAGSLTALNNPAPLATFMTSVADARLLHSASPSLIGDVADTQFGVDNIQALGVAVPEPTTWLMIIGAFLAGCYYLVRMRHRGQLLMEQVCEVEEVEP